MRQKHLGADGHLKSLCKLAGAKLGQRKRSIRSIIYQIIPLRCTRYLEPFGGSFCVLIGKPKAPFEAINDLNPWPVNFFRCLQKDPVRLYRMIRKLLDGFDKERFLKLRRFLVTDNGFVQYKEGFPAAAAFYCVTKMAMNGVIRMNLRGENNSTYCGTTKGRGLLTADWTRRVLHRMKDVRICKMDYWAFLKAFNYSTPRTFTYCDPPPPYDTPFTHYFLGGWHKEDHQKLAHRLRRCGSYWALSYNDSPLIRRLYKGFQIHLIKSFWSVSSTPAGRGEKIELLITNFEIPKALRKKLELELV